MIRVEALTGAALDTVLDDVARLRIAVFRAFPYLYDGSLDYESDYISTYRNSDQAIVVGAFDCSRLIGAATGTPMEDHADDFAKAFETTPYKLEDIFYCAESVLLPEYRGQGIGHRFFDEREAHARRLGRTHSAFCGVIRPDDHPLRPSDHRPLDPFWRKRGYAPLDGVIAKFSWLDVDQASATEKPLQFWLRQL